MHHASIKVNRYNPGYNIENMKEMYKMNKVKSDKSQRIYFTVFQRKSLKLVQYYNNAKPMVLFHCNNGY